MLGNLFYRKVPTSDLKAMAYVELVYWDKWHKVIEDTDRKAIDKARNK